jgi:uncharacterized membrane protein
MCNRERKAMSDQMFTSDNVIAVSFPEEANAYEALARLKELDSGEDVGLHEAAVVAREQDGRITVKDQFGAESFEDTVGGGLLGLLVGVLGGPLGVLLGGASGLLVGSLFDGDDDDETRSALADMSKSIHVGPPGLLAEVAESAPAAVDAVMAHLNGTVVRRSSIDVEVEVAAAEDAQRAAKKKARHELREAHHKARKDKVDAKVAELKAKLPGHQQVAGSRS